MKSLKNLTALLSVVLMGAALAAPNQDRGFVANSNASMVGILSSWADGQLKAAVHTSLAHEGVAGEIISQVARMHGTEFLRND